MQARASERRIAVLGAGLQGALCALELADRNCDVVLYDQQPQAISEASLNNEGKIHLGYIYSNDDLNRTARFMAKSAACFTPILGRWMRQSDLINTASSAFTYLVMRDSLLSPDVLTQKYQQIDTMVADALSADGMSYFGQRALAPTRRLDTSDYAVQFNED